MKIQKRNIQKFGKIFDYLRDPDLRAKEIGDSLLTVRDAEISGADFARVDWKNIEFINCDFLGAYQMKIRNSDNVRYVDCRFSGIFGYGRARKLHFLRCAWTDGSIAYAGEQSIDVLFELCRFFGTTADRNHWGGVGSDGEAEFVNCTGSLFNLDGHAKLVMRQCEFDNVSCCPRASESGGKFSDVLIENCKIKGMLDMRPATLTALTIRDTVVDALDLSKATVKGPVLIEKVTAMTLGLAVDAGQAITLKDVHVTGRGREVFYLSANRFTRVELDSCTLPDGGPDDEEPWIGGALKELAYSKQPPLNQSVIIRNSRVPRLDAEYLNTANLLIESSNLGEVKISHGRIGRMELKDVFISSNLDLRNSQVGEFKQSGHTNLRKLGRALILEGSTVKLPI